MVTLEVKPRDGKSDPDALRAAGLTPAVVYGSKEAATPIEVLTSDFRRVWKEAGETTIVQLTGLADEKQTLIQEVQFHPVTGAPLHIDFYAIEKGQKVQVAIPLHFIGEAPAEKLGHVVVKALHEVEIEVAPHELPHSFDIDISSLNEIGDHITVADIKLPASATTKIDPEEVIVTVSAAKEEPVETPAAPAAEGEAAAEGAAPSPGEGAEAAE